MDVTATFEAVATLSEFGEFVALAFDIEDIPHIVSHDISQNALKYAYRNNDQWIIETIPEGDGYGDVSLALDQSGRPHVAYKQNTGSSSAQLRYAYRQGGSWITEVVDANGYNGRWNSLVIDNFGTPHIAYFSGFPVYDLRYAVKINGEWQNQLIDSAGDTGYGASMVITKKGNLAIAYGVTTSELDGKGLRVAQQEKNSWQITDVAMGNYVGDHVSMAISKQGRVRVAYRSGINPQDTDLSYAALFGSKWRTTTVDVDGDIGYSPSLTLDPAGRPCIGYPAKFLPPGIMRIAFIDRNRWVVRDVKNTQGVSEQAIQYDSEGVLHAAVIKDGALYFGRIDKDFEFPDPESVVGP